MFVRQVKRKCSVRGCKCTDSFAISRTREVGNTVIICKECLSAGLGAIDEIDPKTKSNIPKPEHTKAPALFFNAKALGITAETDADDEAVTPKPKSEQEQEQEQSGSVEGEQEDNSENGEIEATDAEDEAPTSDEASTFECPKCGKPFNSERGLKAHLKHCKAPTAEEPQTEEA